MSLRTIVGIVALAGMSLCGLLSAIMSIQMVEQVNAKLSKESQFVLLGWYAPKTLRLFREYRRLYPGKALHLKVLSIYLVGLLCLLCAAWAIGFF
jgi:hypothetical protein